MHIETSGSAVIRHRDTGEVFEIDPEDIVDLWDSVGADEEPMGTRTTWEAAIEHPELGTLTWQLWEYPEGAFNGTDTDVGRHELISDFQVGLEHDPEDADDQEADGAAIEEMITWFHENYEDPANRVPYESAEGGYQWIYGGPVTPQEAIGDNFSSEYRHELIERAAAQIYEQSGLFDWSPIPGADWAGDDEGDDEPSEERRARLTSEITNEAARIQQALRPLVEIEASAQRDPASGLAGIGHNNPPGPLEDLGLDPTFFAELSSATQEVADRVFDLNAAAEQSAGTADALRDIAAAHRENTEAIKENTRAIEKRNDAILKATKSGIFGSVGLWAGDKVIGEVLTKLGSELADFGVPLLKAGAVGAWAYLQNTAHMLGNFINKVAEFLSLFM